MADTLHGWACHGKGEPLKLTELPLKTWDEDDVEIQITDCGICGTDIHTIDEAWFPADFPVVVGHEIAGIVTRVGKNVTKVKVGDRAGVGAIVHACGECKACTTGTPNCCAVKSTFTYTDHWPSGEKTYGGYADKWRGHKFFVVKIPDNVTNENACSMLCGGVTTYAPLKRWNVGPGSVIGIMGIGGLGHFGVLFAKALGARVVAMSHNDKKREVALELGADEFLNTSDDEQMSKYRRYFTHILCTGTGRDFTWERFLPLINPNGVFINVSAPEWSFPEQVPLLFLMSQVTIASSSTGSPEEAEEMLKLVAEKNIKTWVECFPMDKANEAVEGFRAGKPRFRYVLKN